MPIETDTQLETAHGWTFRFRRAAQSPSQILLLLHGWTGDENSMWAFTRNFPAHYAIVSPRAPHPALHERGGYSWRVLKPGTWGVPTLAELRVAADALVTFVDEWSASVSTDAARFNVIGFSQGGAMATVLAALHPQRMRRVAVLAGFVPPGVDAFLRPNLLTEIPFFWAHGRQDEMIPLVRAQQSINLLEAAGAEVNLCQADVGHKVGKDCRRALEIFFEN
ncbi:MAG: alpha/beta fold hydrolase [Anaerolineales bacterium]|nr:alpha/beta fold hydrolase [Anaerolineales bacterium]